MTEPSNDRVPGYYSMPEDDSGQLRPTRRTYLDIPVGWEAMPEAEKDEVLDGFITLLVEEQGLEVIED